MEKVDLECMGYLNNLETWIIQSNTYFQKTLGVGITILEFCLLIIERKKISRIIGGVWSRLLGVGFGRNRKWNE